MGEQLDTRLVIGRLFVWVATAPATTMQRSYPTRLYFFGKAPCMEVLQGLCRAGGIIYSPRIGITGPYMFYRQMQNHSLEGSEPSSIP